MGFCIGGHLAFRAALQPDVRRPPASTATGIHNGKLGKDADAGSLARAGEIKGELLMVFGTRDPHVPEPKARATIAGRSSAPGSMRRSGSIPAEHAFMRDEGPRYDPVATDQAFADMIALFSLTT